MKKFTILFISLLTFSFVSYAQGEQKFITFSGIVIDGSVDEPLIGAYVINHRAGKGVQTNSSGYFILDVFPGDSLVFSFVGFKPQYHIIPRNTGPSYSAVVELSIDVTMLKEVKVYPYRTEEEFKLAFLNMDTPNEEERKIIESNLGRNTIRSLALASPMSAMGNYRYAIDRYMTHQENQRMINVNPLFNTASWMSFIKDVKSGNAFKDFRKGELNAIPTERNSRDDIFRNSKKEN